MLSNKFEMHVYNALVTDTWYKKKLCKHTGHANMTNPWNWATYKMFTRSQDSSSGLKCLRTEGNLKILIIKWNQSPHMKYVGLYLMKHSRLDVLNGEAYI